MKTYCTDESTPAHRHPRRHKDPAVVWLRRLLYDVAVTVEDEQG